MNRTRLMYVEPARAGAARIGRVRFSRTRRTARYAGRDLTREGDRYRDAETGEAFRLRAPRPDGRDAEEPRAVLVDEDARLEYWRDVRGRGLAMAAV